MHLSPINQAEPAPEIQFYQTHSRFSDPGRMAGAFDDMASGLAAAVAAVQSNLIHAYWLDHYGVAEDRARSLAEMQVRGVAEMLGKLTHLAPGKAPAERHTGVCRHFSLMLCAILRSKAVPCRIRCGFARYFAPAPFMDHWIVEYWHALQQRWVQVDPQLDAIHCAALGVVFDPLDLPEQQFVYAGEAWQMCLDGRADPAQFGIFHFNGTAFIAANMVRDILALAKTEVLPWDSGWGLLAVDLSDQSMGQVQSLFRLDDPFLGELAGCSAGSNTRQARNFSLYDERIKPPECFDCSPTIQFLFDTYDL